MGQEESKKELRNLWIRFAFSLCLFGSFSLYRQGAAWPYLFGFSACFAFFAAFAPLTLMPLYRLWVKFSSLVAWLNSLVLLGLVFFLVISPLGRLLQWSGKDLLDERLDRKASTYWKPRKTRRNVEDYFRQF